MTMTRPLRLMILHLSHIFLTDGLTFIKAASFSGSEISFETVSDSAASQIVRRQFDGNFVARQNADEVHADLAGNVRQNFVAVFQFDLEHRVGQSLDDFAFDFDNVLF